MLVKSERQLLTISDMPFPQKNILPLAQIFRAVCLIALLSAVSSQGREVRTIYMPGSGAAIATAYLVNLETTVQIEFPQRNLSPEVKIPEGDLVMAVLAAPLDAGAKIPAEAPLVSVPAAWERCIFIFLGDPGNKVFPVRVIPVDSSAAYFPKGNTLIYNLSKTTLIAKFGEKLVTAEPGKSKMFGAPIPNFGAYPVFIDYIPEGKTERRTICRSYWQHDPDARQIMFVIPQEQSETPRVWGTLDNSEDKPKKDK